MKKSTLYVTIALLAIGMIIVSGCVDQKKDEEEFARKLKEKISESTQAPPAYSDQGNYPGGQEKGFSEPTFAMIGFVTYQGYTVMSNTPEYSIELVIQSATNKPVTFNKIVAKYYDQRSPNEYVKNIYPTTLAYGEAIKPTIETFNLQEMQNRVENAGKKTIVIYIQLMNNDEKVGGEYSAPLPPLSYMQTLGTNHQIDFALDNTPLYK